MTWQANAASAVRAALSVFSRRGREASAPNTGSRGRAKRIEPPLTLSGTPTPTSGLIQRRALRMAGNTSPDVRRAWVETHMILSRGVCSNDRNMQ